MSQGSFLFLYTHTHSLWNTLNRSPKSEKHENSFLTAKFTVATEPLEMAGPEHRSPDGTGKGRRVHSSAQQIMTCWVSSSIEIIPLRARGWVRPSLGLCVSVGRWREPCPGSGGMPEGGAEGWQGNHHWPPGRLCLPRTGFARLAGINIATPIGLKMSRAATLLHGHCDHHTQLLTSTSRHFVCRFTCRMQKSLGNFVLFLTFP